MSDQFESLGVISDNLFKIINILKDIQTCE